MVTLGGSPGVKGQYRDRHCDAVLCTCVLGSAITGSILDELCQKLNVENCCLPLILKIKGSFTTFIAFNSALFLLLLAYCVLSSNSVVTVIQTEAGHDLWSTSSSITISLHPPEFPRFCTIWSLSQNSRNPHLC